MARHTAFDPDRLHELERLLRVSIEHLHIILDLYAKMERCCPEASHFESIVFDLANRIRDLIRTHEMLLHDSSRYRAEFECLEAAMPDRGISAGRPEEYLINDVQEDPRRELKRLESLPEQRCGELDRLEGLRAQHRKAAEAKKSASARGETEPAPTISEVEFSAIAPKQFEPDSFSVIDIVMYEDGFRHIVDELIAQADEPVQEKRSGKMSATIGSHVKICLSAPGLTIEDDVDEHVWQGKYLNFSFAVSLPADYPKKTILFIATVYINDVIATRLKFTVRRASEQTQTVNVLREDVLSAFISYASQDRHHVATILQGMKKARPDMDIFFDVESLRSGDDWEKTLQSEISRRDVLYLCWSRNAKASQWVDTEWRYALNQKGLGGIEPVPLESPAVCPPPEELKSKHFNDKLLYIINAAKTPDIF